MDWSSLPSDPHAGEGWPHYKYEEKLENENKLLNEQIEEAIKLCDEYLEMEKIEQCTEAIVNAKVAEEYVTRIKVVLEGVARGGGEG